MGLFDSTKDDSREEVRVSVPDESSESNSSSAKTGNSRLRSEVESKVGSGGKKETRMSGGSKASSSSVGLNDIHQQNQRIIELLEQITNESPSSSSRVTDRKDDQNDSTDVGSGMNELL